MPRPKRAALSAQLERALVESHMFSKTRNPVFALEAFVAACKAGSPDELSRWRSDTGTAGIVISLDKETAELLRKGFTLYLRRGGKKSLDSILGLRNSREPAMTKRVREDRNFALLLEIARLRGFPMRVATAIDFVAARLERDGGRKDTREARSESYLRKLWLQWPERHNYERHMREHVGRWTAKEKRDYLEIYPSEMRASLPDHLKILFPRR